MKNYESIYVWELPIRIGHWVLVACIFTLFTTGLYISNPIFPATGGEAFSNYLMGTIRHVHFVTGFILICWIMLRTYWAIAGNQYAKFRPWRPEWRENFRITLANYLFLSKEGSKYPGHNAVAELAYFIFIWMGTIMIAITGLAMLSEVNPTGTLGTIFWPVISFFGASMPVRLLHHLNAWGFMIFLVIHLYMVIRADVTKPKGEVSSIINGYKFKEKI